MEVKVEFFEKIEDIMEAARIGDMKSLNTKAKIVDKKPELIAYNIQRKFLSEISTLPDSTVGGKVRQELKQGGIALLLNEDERTVEINQFDDVWTALNRAEANEVSNSEIPMLENAEGSIAQEIAQGVSEEAAEEAIEESVEEVEAAESAEANENDENDLNDISEAYETDKTDESASEFEWDFAIILFNATGLNTQILYDKAVEAGQYKVYLGNVEQRDSAEDIDAITENTDEIEDAVNAEDAENTVNAEGSTGDSIGDNDTEDADVAVDNVDDTATSFDLALFLIQNIFDWDVFDSNSSPITAHTASISGNNAYNANNAALIIGKTLYLTSKAKGISAIGVMISEKRILVKAGSTVSTENRLPHQKGQGSSANLRQKLLDDGVIVDGRFVVDYEFSSTSAAASVIMGQSASGMTSWRDETGWKLETLLGTR